MQTKHFKPGDWSRWTMRTRGALAVQGRPLYATVAALVLLSLPFIFRPYIVTGGSMEPAYSEGQVVLVETLTPYFSVWRGEVLVIRNPHDHSVTDIKRVVGLPNEDVNLGENSITVTHSDGHAETFGPPLGEPGTAFFHMHLGPEDYMVLGDNRSKSTDSRDFGAVQAGDIIGHVLFRL
jgi:signal peptidase I